MSYFRSVVCDQCGEPRDTDEEGSLPPEWIARSASSVGGMKLHFCSTHCADRYYNAKHALVDEAFGRLQDELVAPLVDRVFRKVNESVGPLRFYDPHRRPDWWMQLNHPEGGPMARKWAWQMAAEGYRMIITGNIARWSSKT